MANLDGYLYCRNSCSKCPQMLEDAHATCPLHWQ